MRYLLFLFLLCNFSWGQEGTQERESSLISNNVLKDFKQSNPFAQMSPEDMRKLIQEKSKSSSLGSLITKYPKLEDFLSHWYVDKEAVPKLFSIMDDSKKVKAFFIKFIIAFVIGLMIIHYLTRGESSFVMKLIKKMSLNFVLMFCVWLIFYYSFRDNIDPTLDLMKTHLL